MTKKLCLSVSIALSGISAFAADTTPVRMAVYQKIGDVKTLCYLEETYIFADGTLLYSNANFRAIPAQIKIPAQTKRLTVRNFSAGRNAECKYGLLELSDGATQETVSTNATDFVFSMSENGTGRDIVK